MKLTCDGDELRVLVQLWLAHATRAPPLAEVLLARRSAVAVAALDEWRPGVMREASRVLAALAWAHIHVVPIWNWPWQLARARPLAPALMVRGDVGLLWRSGVGIVGARRAHGSAESWARHVARGHVLRGELVVSGGARGVDTAAHLGALDAGGQTLAYIGAAADCIYPKHNRGLFLRILQSGGALVSEHLPLSKTYKGAHALRNRFIAAHASRLYVAEADVDSGSLGTAGFAKRWGVPVLVPPADIGVRRAGIAALIAEGAAVVETVGGRPMVPT